MHRSASLLGPILYDSLSCQTRRSPDIHFQNSTASISGQRPVILLQATQDSSEKLRRCPGSPVDSPALWVAGLSGTLIIGALLVPYLSVRKRRCVPQTKCVNKTRLGASLVAQWLRLCLLMQGTRVRSLVWEDPTCRGATGPVSHNY